MRTASDDQPPTAAKVIYDLGANNGDDIPYYLLKADVVVAVEANPVLCELIGKRFRAEIDGGRLKIENCVVTDRDTGHREVDFYIHKGNHAQSQFPRPATEDLSSFERVTLPAKPISEIIHRHGPPLYIKIDIERYDAQILRSLFRERIYPPFISAESHSIEVFALLVAEGGYDSFKLVDGESVSRFYQNWTIGYGEGGRPVTFSFPHHSAGPFGNDVDGPWMTADNFFKVLALEGLGWKDIHATKHAVPNPSATVDIRYVFRHLLRKIRKKLRNLGGLRPRS